MLRASIEISGKTADVSAITGAENAETDGVPSAAALVCFAEAAVGGTDAELSLSRARVVRELGAEALVDAAVAAGLPRSVATDLVTQTMAGSAAMLLEQLDQTESNGSAQMGSMIDTSAAQLRATVTSPGGTTAAGLRELERGGLRSAVASAVEAAKRRSEQLGITSE